MARGAVWGPPRASCCAAILGAAAATTPSLSNRTAELRPAPTAMEQRNLLLAIVVSVGILIGFQYLFVKLRPPPPVSPAAPAAVPAAPGPPPPATAAAARGAETREQAIAEQPRVRINTPRLHGSVAL